MTDTNEENANNDCEGCKNIEHQLRLLAIAIHDDKPASLKNWASDYIQMLDGKQDRRRAEE